MPHDEPHAPLVKDKIDNGFCESFDEASVGNLPYFDHAILGAAGDYVVIVGAPCNIKNRPFVAPYQGVIGGDASNLQN